MSEKKGVLRILHLISALLEKFINFWACVLLVVISLAVIVQVLGRTTNIPVVWLGELSTYCTIWVVFMGLAIGYKHGLFAQVDIICHIVSKSWKKYLEILWGVVALIIMGLILWSSRDYIAHVARAKTASPELRLPLYLVYLGPIIGYIFTCWFTLVNIADQIAAIITGTSAPHDSDTDKFVEIVDSVVPESAVAAELGTEGRA